MEFSVFPTIEIRLEGFLALHKRDSWMAEKLIGFCGALKSRKTEGETSEIFKIIRAAQEFMKFVLWIQRLQSNYVFFRIFPSRISRASTFNSIRNAREA
jgi:hypothetical protein